MSAHVTAPDAAYQQGYRDGFAGVPAPDIHPTLVEHYARGRRAGTARSGRLPPPRPALFDSEFCRAVLARPFDAPRLDLLTCGPGESGEPPSIRDEAL